MRPLPSPPDEQQPLRCEPDAGARCTSHRPGHALHPISAGLAARTPQFWRSAVVTAVEPHAGGVAFTAAWVEDLDPRVAAMPGESTAGSGPEVRCWHHAPRPELVVGYPLRLHDEFLVAETGRGAFGVLLRPAGLSAGLR